MDKKSKILVLTFIVFVLVSIFLTYQRSFIKQNFIIDDTDLELE